jgi:hypothetical protein
VGITLSEVNKSNMMFNLHLTLYLATFVKDFIL